MTTKITYFGRVKHTMTRSTAADRKRSFGWVWAVLTVLLAVAIYCLAMIASGMWTR